MEQIDSVTPAAMLRLKNNNTQSALDTPPLPVPQQLTQPNESDMLRVSPELIDKLYHDKRHKHSAELKFNMAVKGLYIRDQRHNNFAHDHSATFELYI